MTTPRGRPPGRLLFADWLRAWALLVMIETHVFNAFLATGLRQETWFQTLTFINGLVAPSFLFVSGFVFLVAAQKRAEELRTLGKAFWKQVQRIGMVLAIGYAMHLSDAAPYKVDVLHCIAVTWLFLLLSLVAIRSEFVLRLWLAAWAVAMTAFAPMVWSSAVHLSLTAPLAAYLNGNAGSLFPIFPWSGFMLAGALCASWFLGARRADKERHFMAGAAALGLLMILAGELLPSLSPRWMADPRTFLLRLGIVLLLLAICWLYGRFRQPARSLLLDVSRESLFVYVVHLFVIYGPIAGGVSLAHVIGRSRAPMECALGSLVLGAMMLGGPEAGAP